MRKTKYYFNCEDGKDICIESFDSFEECLAYAENDEDVKEIWRYEIDEQTDEIIDCECLWFKKRFNKYVDKYKNL